VIPNVKPAFLATEKQVFGRFGLEPSGRIIELADPPVSLRLLETGIGEPVVFMHGISLASAHWAPIIARLRSNRCAMIDMPGHGGSAAVDFRGVDLRQWHNKMLIALLDQLSLPCVHIVGHSYGGMIAMWLALDAPARVASVVSIGTPSLAFGARPDLMFRASAMRAVGPLMLKSPMPGVAHRAVLARALGRPAIKAAAPDLIRVAYLATRRPGFATTASRYLREQFRGARATPPRYRLSDGELARIERPVLVVWGDQDTRYQPTEEGRQKAALMPQGRFELVPGGHEPWLDNTEVCARVIASFLDHARAAAA
jgi:pimeloyl-ACP methyl ester carboxylesterase